MDEVDIDVQVLVDTLSDSVREMAFLLAVKDAQIRSLTKERDALASENDHLLKKKSLVDEVKLSGPQGSTPTPSGGTSGLKVDDSYFKTYDAPKYSTTI